MAKRYAIVPAYVVADLQASFGSMSAALSEASLRVGKDGTRRAVVKIIGEICPDYTPRAKVHRSMAAKAGAAR